MPSGGRLLSAALVRTMIQWASSQVCAGTVKVPVKTAPACSAMVSPHFALFSASWKSPPLGTEIVVPGAGVCARSLCT